MVTVSLWTITLVVGIWASYDKAAKHILCVFWILTVTVLTSSVVTSVELLSCPSQRYSASSMFSEDDGVSGTSHYRNQQQNVKKKDGTEPSITDTDNTALAVVLYKESTLLPHEKKNRSFTIAGHDFYIEQDWHAGGVAAVVWDAAVVLGDYMASNTHLVQGKKVLELGAGTGLAGMVAASLGADVIVTEREQALSFLQTAVSKNEKGKDWKVKVEVLDWTHEIDSSKWNSFDLIIGADIIYIESTFSDLLKTIKSVANSTKTQILLSCRIRYERDLNFLKMLENFYIIEEIFYNSKLDIKIFSAVSKS